MRWHKRLFSLTVTHSEFQMSQHSAYPEPYVLQSGHAYIVTMHLQLTTIQITETLCRHAHRDTPRYTIVTNHTTLIIAQCSQWYIIWFSECTTLVCMGVSVWVCVCGRGLGSELVSGGTRVSSRRLPVAQRPVIIVRRTLTISASPESGMCGRVLTVSSAG